MDWELLFTVANTVALLGWLTLLVAPRWRWTRAGATVAVVFLLALGYIALLVTGLGGSDGDFRSLEGVMRLFDSPHATLAGWVHYLAFDLFVASWISADWTRTGRPHAWILGVLVLTFLAGPAGLALYLVVRALVHRDARVALAGGPVEE